MFCPKCGNECVDEDICPHCGQELHSFKDIITNDKLDALVGRYEGIDGYVDLSYFTITIHKVLDSSTFEHIIPHEDIVDVVFQPASAISNGYLVLYRSDNGFSIVENEWDAMANEMAILFDRGSNQELSKLCDFLQFSIRSRLANNVSNISKNKNNTEDVHCPKCGSIRFCANKKQPPRHFYRSKSLVIEIIRLCLFIAWFIFHGKKKEYYCYDCGHEWVE